MQLKILILIIAQYVYKLLLLLCPTDEFYVRKESERCLERRKQEQENTNKQQSVEP